MQIKSALRGLYQPAVPNSTSNATKVQEFASVQYRIRFCGSVSHAFFPKAAGFSPRRYSSHESSASLTCPCA